MRTRAAHQPDMSERTLIIAVVVVAILVGGGYWAFRAFEDRVPERTVAFDNVYGTVTEVPIFVTVDSGLEQELTATCDAKACTFKLPLTNARHELTVSVVIDGRRSAPARVTLDTTDMR